MVRICTDACQSSGQKATALLRGLCQFSVRRKLAHQFRPLMRLRVDERGLPIKNPLPYEERVFGGALVGCLNDDDVVVGQHWKPN